MFKTPRTITGSLAIFLLLGTMAPTFANARTPGNKTKTDSGKSANIAIHVYNRGQISQDIKIDGQTYTVPSHQSVAVKGAAGSIVIADTAGNGYQKGAALFTFTSAMAGATVSIN
jgi:hypothetical protein